MNKHTLRVYGRAELARLYCGKTANDNSALKWLMREIKNFPGLYEKLVRLGFKKSEKIHLLLQRNDNCCDLLVGNKN